jgi:molecular chaperone IbpA
MLPNLPFDKIDTTLLNKALVGFEPMFRYSNFANSNANYPPYNIIMIDDDHYEIEIAVAGFNKSEISIEVEREMLIVNGSKNKQDEVEKLYQHRGLSSRDFVRTFTLAEHVSVTSASITDGILSVLLTREIPEEKKRKLIQITEV